MSREPEAWQTNEARPFSTIEKPRGTVSISALGHDSQVEGYQEARALAHRLAEGLD
jgi:hypothetical protein